MAQEAERVLADVDLKQSLEDSGIALKKSERVVTKAGGAVQQQHDASHKVRQSLDGPMCLLIGCEVAGLQSFCERKGLAKTEAQAFAGYCVDGA